MYASFTAQMIYSLWRKKPFVLDQRSFKLLLCISKMVITSAADVPILFVRGGGLGVRIKYKPLFLNMGIVFF